jgi:hypothetical protein
MGEKLSLPEVQIIPGSKTVRNWPTKVVVLYVPAY